MDGKLVDLGVLVPWEGDGSHDEDERPPGVATQSFPWVAGHFLQVFGRHVWEEEELWEKEIDDILLKSNPT